MRSWEILCRKEKLKCFSLSDFHKSNRKQFGKLTVAITPNSLVPFSTTLRSFTTTVITLSNQTVCDDELCEMTEKRDKSGNKVSNMSRWKSQNWKRYLILLYCSRYWTGSECEYVCNCLLSLLYCSRYWTGSGCECVCNCPLSLLYCSRMILDRQWM